MSLFVFDTDEIVRQILPPVLRGKKMLAWLRVILRPVQWLVDLFLSDFLVGTNYDFWSGSASYNVGDIITWRTKENYLCIKDHDSTADTWPSGKKLSAVCWLKIQDNFIGLDERMTYNAQIIKLEQQLNKWFRIGAVPYAYVANTSQHNQFLMSRDTGDYVVNDPAYSTAYMSNVYQPAQYDFTVYVPESCFVPLNLATPADRENVVRQFVDQYKVPGTSYKVEFIPPPSE